MMKGSGECTHGCPRKMSPLMLIRDEVSTGTCTPRNPWGPLQHLGEGFQE